MRNKTRAELVAEAREYVIDDMAAQFIEVDEMDERQAFDLAAGYAVGMDDDTVLLQAGLDGIAEGR